MARRPYPRRRQHSRPAAGLAPCKPTRHRPRLWNVLRDFDAAVELLDDLDQLEDEIYQLDDCERCSWCAEPIPPGDHPLGWNSPREFATILPSAYRGPMIFEEEYIDGELQISVGLRLLGAWRWVEIDGVGRRHGHRSFDVQTCSIRCMRLFEAALRSEMALRRPH